MFPNPKFVLKRVLVGTPYVQNGDIYMGYLGITCFNKLEITKTQCKQ
jgi:hypothetical protein